MQVKFCGVTKQENIDAINDLRPDFVGFVFWEPSKRFVNVEQARKLAESLCPKICTVGVFVDESAQTIAKIFNEGIIKVAQLHGQENEEFISQLRAIAPEIKIWKAFEVSNEMDIVHANNSSADLVLLDGGKGEGNVFPWELLSGINRDFALAGGLNETNIAEALMHCKTHAKRLPPIIDVSSGIEVQDDDGKPIKSFEKMTQFLKTIREGEY